MERLPLELDEQAIGGEEAGAPGGPCARGAPRARQEKERRGDDRSGRGSDEKGSAVLKAVWWRLASIEYPKKQAAQIAMKQMRAVAQNAAEALARELKDAFGSAALHSVP